jgi:peptidoglycan/xylan/chitin deacetylase (PgdA/CDA1 family)
MYHYVRPLGRSRFPAIKGLDLALFEEQLEYLARHYCIVGMDLVLDALDARCELPRHAALLTFDDGYLDHYTYVFPLLAARGWSAAFFPPATSAIERKVLDANKVHFVLATTSDLDAVVEHIERACLEAGRAPGDLAGYREKYWKPGVYDDAKVNYVKRMLQVGLAEELRAKLAGQLFARYVSADETAFAEELYATVEQLRHMVGAGMHVGSHGDTHRWLSSLAVAEQKAELEGSFRLLRAVGVPPHRYTICYPYGDYDGRTLEVAAACGFQAGFTTKVALAQIDAAHRLTLPRLDTNDLPKSRDASGDACARRV